MLEQFIKVFGSGGKFFAYYPRPREGATEAEVREATRKDIIGANFLNDRTDSSGKLLPGKTLLTRQELMEGVKRPDPRTFEEMIADGQRHEGVFVKPAPPMSAEERLNAALKERKAQQELEKLSPLDRQIVESEKRLTTERAEAERQKIRERPDFKAASERLDALEYFAKFDRHLSPVVLQEIQHQRRVLLETLDVPAVTANLRQIQEVALQQRQVANLNLRAAIDAAEQAAQPWREGMLFDEPPRRVIDSNQEFVIYKRGGKGLAIHAASVEGLTDEQVARQYFPDTFSEPATESAA